MALKLLQPGTQPLGQFDGYDNDVLTLKGGEIVSFAGVPSPGTDKAAYDAFDGYVQGTAALAPGLVQLLRPAVSRHFDGTTSLTAASRPLMLSDDGIAGYGTIFGTVVGGSVGQVSYGPHSVVPASGLLGPHTASGSGKVTCWDKPGLYGVSLDAVDTAANGLVTTNTTLTVGSALTFTSLGLLTPVTGGNGLGGAPTVATLVEFDTNQSLVTTPNFLVQALNSPSDMPDVKRKFAFATIWFNAGM
jgi:hypothetical protein